MKMCMKRRDEETERRIHAEKRKKLVFLKERGRRRGRAFKEETWNENV